MRLRRLALTLALGGLALGPGVVAPSRAALPPRYDFVLRVSPEGAVNTLDPCRVRTLPERDLIAQLFEGLVRRDATGIRPAVALEWSASSDSLTWTFRLDPHRRFGEGTAVRANDVVASWQRAARESPEWAWLFDGLRPEALDSLTVRLRLTTRLPDLLDRLALPAASISREITTSNGRSLSGCGAFRFAGRGEEGFVLAPRLDDPRGRPFAGRVFVKPAETAAAQQALWRSGSSAIADGAGLGDRPPGGVRIARATPTAWLLLVNPKRSALQSLAARLALWPNGRPTTHADGEDGVESLAALANLWPGGGGAGPGRQRPAPRVSPTGSASPVPLAIVADGGDRVSVALSENLAGSLSGGHQAAESMQMGTGAFRQALKTGDYDLLVLRWDAPAARASLALPELLGRPELIRLVPEGTPAPVRPLDLLELLTEQRCLIPLARQTPTIVARADLSGVALDPLTGALRLADVWPTVRDVP